MSSSKIAPVVQGDGATTDAKETATAAAGEEEGAPAEIATVAGTDEPDVAAAAVAASDEPDKAYNDNVASVFRSQVLQGIGNDGRDKDGNILRDKLYKALAALYKSSSAPLDDDPARLAAALCFASTEAAPDAMSDA